MRCMCYHEPEACFGSSFPFASSYVAGLWKKMKGWKEVLSRDEGSMEVKKRSAYCNEGRSWSKVMLTLIDCWQTQNVTFYIELMKNERSTELLTSLF